MTGDTRHQQPMYLNIPDEDTLAQCLLGLATLHRDNECVYVKINTF